MPKETAEIHDDRESLLNALATINRSPEQDKLHEVATNTSDPKALSDLRELVNSSFAQLNSNRVKRKVEPSPEEIAQILGILKEKFKASFPELDWEKVEKTLKANPEYLRLAIETEKAGNNPAIIDVDDVGFSLKDYPDDTLEKGHAIVGNRLDHTTEGRTIYVL